MKKNRFLLLTALLFLAGISGIRAQRYADLRFSIVSPLNGTVIANGDSEALQMQLTNNGPDTFRTTDTMYIFGNLPGMPGILRGASNQPIPPGVSAAMQFSGPLGTVINNRAEATDTTMELCLSIVTGNLMMPPVPTEVLDTLPLNNKSCVTLTLKGKPATTGIAGRTGTGQSSLMLYPNPARDQVTFAITLKAEQSVKAIIRDMTGRTVMTNDYGSRKTGQTSLALDVSRLPAGMYSMEVQSGEQVQTGKLVIR